MDAVPYQKAKNSNEDHLAAPVTTFMSGRGSMHVELQPRAPCGNGSAGRTESYVRTPSIATPGQDHLPVFGQDLPEVYQYSGSNPMKRQRTTLWAGCNLNVADGRAIVHLRIIRVLQAPAQHNLSAEEAVRGWREPKSSRDPCVCCTVDVRCRRYGGTHTSQGFACR